MQGLSKKRQRAEIQEEPNPNDAFAVLSTALLVHVLSFAYRSFYVLSLTCKRIYRITKTDRVFWRTIALRYFERTVPKQILLQMDFFFGLRIADPAYAWLWKLLRKRKVTPHNTVLDFQYVFDRYENESRALHFTWDYPNNQDVFTQSLGIDVAEKDESEQFVSKVGSYIRTWWMNDDTRFVEVGRVMNDDGDEETLYGEYLCNDRTKHVWCGAVTINASKGMYNGFQPFGHYVPLSEYKRKILFL